jgi:hypothetical protein
MKNSIFSDPRGWASKAVGSCVRYRVMQSFTLLAGGALGFILYLICREAGVPLFGYFVVLVMLLIAAVELPLFYPHKLSTPLAAPGNNVRALRGGQRLSQLLSRINDQLD